MSFNTGPANSSAINANAPTYGRGMAEIEFTSLVYAVGFPIADIEQRVIYGQGRATADVKSILYASGHPEVWVSQRVNYGLGVYSVPMQQLIYAVGQVNVNVEQRVNQGTGGYSVDIQQNIVGVKGYASAHIRQVINIPGIASASIQQNITNPSGVASVNIQQASYTSGLGPSVQVTQAIIDNVVVDTPPEHVEWAAYIRLGGSDITDNITGQIRVEGEESTSRIAEFSFDPLAGTYNLTDWVGKSVQIFYEVRVPSGHTSRVLLFTGVVDVPEYDPVTQLVHISATDNLQGRFEQATNELITEEIGGYWSRHIFNEDSRGWEYFQERMSTQAYSYDLDVNGAGHKTPWSSPSAARFTFTEDDINDESITLAYANRRDILNTVNISIDFRYQRLRSRELYARWHYGGSWCEFLVNPWILPTKEMLQSGVESTGWALRAISFTDIPSAGYFYCGGSSPTYWSPGAYGDDESQTRKFAIGVDAHIQKRWAQTVTETYSIKVLNDESVTYFGVISEQEDYGIEAEQDVSDWEQRDEYLSTSSMPITISAAGPSPTESGDDIIDADEAVVENGRAEMENAQLTAIAKARTAIKKSHRRNYVGFSTVLAPRIERYHTIQINTALVSAKGKVYSVVHTMDVDSGEATTNVTLALSKLAGSGLQVDREIEVLPKPDTSPTVVPAPEEPEYIGYNRSTHVGSGDDSPVFNESWRGLLTNYIPSQGAYGAASSPPLPEKVYPFEFRYETPAIDDADVQEVIGLAEDEVQVLIPGDSLTVTTT